MHKTVIETSYIGNKRHSKNIASQAKKTELFYKMDEMLFPLILIKIILKYISL